MLACIFAASAAPLDAQLIALQRPDFIEFASDAMNSTLDILKVRNNDAVYAGTTVGDYQGFHLRGSYALSKRIALDGGYWNRTLFYRNETAPLSTWQLGSQIKLLGRERDALQLAMHLSVWGNGAQSLAKSSPTTIAGQTLQGISVVNPRDFQKQMDMVASWIMSDQLLFSVFSGMGVSQVSVDGLTATMVTNGQCQYALNFTDVGMDGQLQSACSTPFAPLNFSFAGAQFSVLQNLQYTSRYRQAGASLLWRSKNWRAQLGYQRQLLTRDGIDDVILSQGGTPYRNNNVLVFEVENRIYSSLWLFVRGQAMSNQFVGEIPFSYNSFTASKFDRKYGFVSGGLKMEF